jgi:site-specific recombinase XerD
MQIADARDKWLRVLRSEGKSPKTLEIYSSAVDRFVDYQRIHHGPTDVAKITREDIQGFLTHLQTLEARTPPTTATEPYERSLTGSQTAQMNFG